MIEFTPIMICFSNSRDLNSIAFEILDGILYMF